MIVWITEWGLQSYLDMKKRQVFTDQEYWNEIRPDVKRLKSDVNGDPKFQNSKFWSQATGANGIRIQYGYKMKWHNIGSGQIQLRLCVAILSKSVTAEDLLEELTAETVPEPSSEAIETAMKGMGQ